MKRGRPKQKQASAVPSPLPEVQEEETVYLQMPFKKPNFKRVVGARKKNPKQIIQGEKYHLWPVNMANYVNIDAPPSLVPNKKYCDITGLEASYTEPKTGLRYHSVEIYKLINQLPQGGAQPYLSLRGAEVVLK